ncbi:dynamin GTPase [Apiospora rasikravindrae]|uniref:Dynamin GTPase n=1 Tax=Apiospora rasikravindrae TaxID=990691 RepID=A0ABR1TA39_9PEZI
MLHVEGKVAQIIANKQKMDGWVKEVYLSTKGRELPGSYNYSLLAELFQEQSSPWCWLARSHIRSIFIALTKWVKQDVEQTIPDEKLRREVLAIYRRWHEDTETRANDELENLLADERRPPMTYNHYYTDNVQMAQSGARVHGVTDALNNMPRKGCNGDLQSSDMETETKFVVANSHANGTIKNMDDQACSEALISLDAYYKVAMKTFVDNVCRQVVERRMLARLPDMFNPTIIAQFSDGKLMLIGSESISQKQRREDLNTRKRVLAR